MSLEAWPSLHTHRWAHTGTGSSTGSGLFCLGRVVLRVAGATLSRAEGGPEGQLRPVAGEAGGTRPLECSEARLRPGGSCGRPGRVPPLPRVEGTGLGPGHGYRAVDQATRAPREAGTGSRDSKHETQAHMSKHVDKWAQIHRPEGHQPQLDTWTQCGIILTTGDSWHYGTRELTATGADPGHGVQGMGEGPFGTTALEL